MGPKSSSSLIGRGNRLVLGRAQTCYTHTSSEEVVLLEDIFGAVELKLPAHT